MRALKILNIVMGVVLIAGFAFVVAVIAARLSHRSPSRVRPAFTDASVDFPRGARIEAMTATPDRLILDVVLSDGGRRLVLIDMATGARLGTIELRAPR